MEYLKKRFSIYMGGKEIPKADPMISPAMAKWLHDWHYGPTREIDPDHEYVEFGGMCRVCTLDRIGHAKKYGGAA
jgi:hypothetical protein